MLVPLTVSGNIGPPVFNFEVLDEIPVKLGLLSTIASISMPIADVLPALFPSRWASPLAAPSRSSRSGTGSQTPRFFVSYRCIGQRPALRRYAPTILCLGVTLNRRIRAIGSADRPYARSGSQSRWEARRCLWIKVVQSRIIRLTLTFICCIHVTDHDRSGV